MRAEKHKETVLTIRRLFNEDIMIFNAINEDETKIETKQDIVQRRRFDEIFIASHLRDYDS